MVTIFTMMQFVGVATLVTHLYLSAQLQHVAELIINGVIVLVVAVIIVVQLVDWLQLHVMHHCKVHTYIL